MVSLYCPGAPSPTEQSKLMNKTRPGGVGGVKNFSLLGLLVGLPAPSPEPLLTLLRAKIEVKVTRPQVTLRLGSSRAIEAQVYTAVSRAKIRGAPAAVSNVKSSNVTLKPAEGGVGALLKERSCCLLLVKFHSYKP